MDITPLAHDLFLLMLNLAQLQSTERIVEIFVDALNRSLGEINPGLSMRISLVDNGAMEREGATSQLLEIATAHHRFGWVVLEGAFSTQPPELLSLIRNAVRMLALILENRAREKLLADDRLRLEAAVAERTAALLQANHQLQAEIAERRQAQAALQEKSTELQHYFNLSPDLLCIADMAGSFLRLNPQWEEALGYSLAELEGQKFMDFVHPGDVDATVEAVSRLEAQQEITNFVNRYRCKEGNYRWLEWHSLPMGMLIYAVARDITERKQAEEALRRSEALYRQAIEVLGAVPYVQDYEREAYVFMGEGIEALTGYAAEEMTPALWNSLVAESTVLQDGGWGREHAIALAQNGSLPTWRSDDYIRTRDGEMRWVMDAAVEIQDEEGRVVRSLGILQDVTERKRTNEALRESNRRLEEALLELQETQDRLLHQERLAAVGQLAAGIAHDFNNILGAITLYTQLSLRANQLSPLLRQRLEVIADQADRAAELVQQILDFGRRSVLERQPLSLQRVLEQVASLLQRTLPENIRLHLSPAPQEELSFDDFIHADPTRIQQALINLALNARDAMPEGGTLRLALSRTSAPISCVDCGTVTAGEWLAVSITDTGTGISSKVLPHIFEPFFTTRAPLGHGLGLAQVHGIVKQHGGHLAVETEVGAGTTFHLYWPVLHEAPAQPVPPSPIEVRAGRGETLLVVEDNATLREVLVEVFEMLGYRVLEAAHGREALNLYEEHASNIALVVSDWVMPVLGGSALVQALAERDPSVKIVMLTGYPTAAETKERTPANVVGWVSKPPDLEQLSNVITEALQR